MPRIETTRTLARSLGPEPPPSFGAPTFDVAIDSLALQQLLGGQGWARAWRDRDSAGFTSGVAHIVRTGHALARIALSKHPQQRGAYWAQARSVLTPVEGPGGQDRRLARIGAEWAALAAPPATDRLFALRPAAWAAVCAGGDDALTTSLLDDAARRDTPCLVIDTDTGCGDTKPARAPLHAVASFTCLDFEQEAQVAAAQVLKHLAQQQVPVGLIAHDRALVRRVRALLERAGASISDETGWKLSTTRAAARVMTLLRAAQDGASSDALFDWLKTGLDWAAFDAPAVASAVRSLEARGRRQRIAQAADLAGVAIGPETHKLLACARASLVFLGAPTPLPLAPWLVALGRALQHCGAWAALSADDAGRQVLGALHLDATVAAQGGDLRLAANEPISLVEFVRWVDLALESTSFVPPRDAAEPTQVVITPLVQAMLRPFAALVFPGSDASRLGAAAAPHPLLSDAQALALGLPGVERARVAESLAFAQVLNVAPLSLVRRRHDAGEPVGVSPLVEQLAIRLRRSGQALGVGVDPRAELRVPATPVAPTAPSAPGLLPQRLSASAFEALRDCPYRFFGRTMLRLREPDELDRDLEKRDYGTWLHQVLHRFHAGRQGGDAAAVEVARLHALAQASESELRMAAADFLPFRASFRALAPRYIDWLHERDRAGLQWTQGEYPVTLELPAPASVTLEGQIDRIDTSSRAGEAVVHLIDYKTGHVDGLKRRVSEPLEDTQLVFYAALLLAKMPPPLRAGYLPLDSSKPIDWVEHKGVAESAAALLTGLASEYARLRRGAVMPALGEGDTCEYCEMRGLCRRDDWAAGTAP